jgi:hypothetical protein
MLTFDWNPNTETRAEAVERFRKTGALPPSWRQMTQRSFLNSLGTLMELEITPVLDDQELKAALENATKWIPSLKHSA